MVLVVFITAVLFCVVLFFCYLLHPSPSRKKLLTLNLSIVHSLLRLHLDFEIELPLQSVCKLHFHTLILFQWSVFSCGHCICCQCAWVLLRQAGVGPRHRNVHVKCPMCRIPTIAQEISYVSTATTQKEESEENVSVKVSVKNMFTRIK